MDEANSQRMGNAIIMTAPPGLTRVCENIAGHHPNKCMQLANTISRSLPLLLQLVTQILHREFENPHCAYVYEHLVCLSDLCGAGVLERDTDLNTHPWIL
jgi:hypothetical protein